MLRQFGFLGNCTNTASTTLPLGNLVSSSTIQPEVTRFTVGSDASALNAAKYALQYGTTVGTWGGSGGAAITPKPTGPNRSVTSTTTANQGVCSVGPTLTANDIPWGFGLNQQATYEFNAYPGSGIFLPPTNNASLNLMSLVAATAYNAVFSFIFSE